MSVQIEVGRFTAQTAGGLQELKHANLGTLVPAGAILMGGYVTSASVGLQTAVDAGFFFGATSDDLANVVATAMSEDAVSSVDHQREALDTRLAVWIDRAGSTAHIGEASINAFIAGGIEIDWDQTPVSAFEFVVIFFAGTDVEDSALPFIPVNAFKLFGFRPELAFGTHISTTWSPPGQGGTGSAFEVGAQTLHEDAAGDLDEAGYSYMDTEGNFRGMSVMRGTDNEQFVGIPRPNPPGGFTTEQHFKNPTDDGADIIGGASSRHGGGLVLDLGGANVTVVEVDAPTVAGTWVVDEIGFRPQFVMLLMGLAEEYNTVYNDVVPPVDPPNPIAGAFAVGVFTQADQHTIGITNEVSTIISLSNTSSYIDDIAGRLLNDVQASVYDGSFHKFTNDGFEMIFTEADSTQRKWLVAAVGYVEGEAVDDDCTPNPWTTDE